MSNIKGSVGKPQFLIVWVFVMIYRILFGWLTQGKCRFYPSCSQFVLESFRNYSFIKAIGYSLKRISSCHPWHPGGYDPVCPKGPPYGK